MATNEITLFNSSVSTVEGNTSINNDIEQVTINEDMILAQLNELRMWQESQRKTLEQGQIDQQKMLQLEKQKLYALFGLVNEESTIHEIGAYSTESSFVIENGSNNVYETPKIHKLDSKQQKIYEKSLELHSPSINQLEKIIKNMTNRSPRREIQQEYQDTLDIPKRPYLKRGEGLKNRFKISPDAFRLDKLPKYKYAQRTQKHAQSRCSRKQRHHGKITTIDTTAGEGVTTISEGQQNNPKDDCIATHENNNGKLKEQTKRPSPRTRQLKLIPNATQQNNLKSSSNDLKRFLQQTNQDVSSGVDVKQSILPKSRSNLLSPATKPLLDTPTRERLQLQQDELKELTSFVRLEENFKTDESALDMDRGRQDENLVVKFKVGLNISPKHYIGNRQFVDIEEVDEEQEKHSNSSDSSMDDESRHVRFQSRAMAIERTNQSRTMVDQSVESIYDVPRTSSPCSTDSFQKFKEKLFDGRLKQKYINRLSVAKDFEISDMNFNRGNCGIDDESGTQATAIDFNDTDGMAKNELQERLLSLEQEIHLFREQNNELTKLIREHEMIRMKFEEEQRDAKEQLENERINFEMYMHDERKKMLDEKLKWEKKTKESRTITQSEKDELARLREKCSSHEAELSAREQKHVAAQGRIRAQMRNVEKDLKECRFEMENLQRENKKLEAENMRLRRQSNSKILNEINKSISKLAHTHDNEIQFDNQKDAINEKKNRPSVKKCSNKNAHKTVVAKVTSHREPLNGINHMRSKSVPNLQSENTETYELCSSPTASEECDENSDGSSHDGNGINKSNYFPTQATNEKRIQHADDDDYDKSVPKQYDETDMGKQMKRIIENPDGSKDIWYPNGNLKKVSADGMCIRMLYFNKDIKETDIKEGTVKYYYAETNTWQTTYIDGLEIFEYPDGQNEHRYKDGRIEIYFPNGTVRITNPNREKQEGIKEEWKYPDGTNAVQMTNGERILLLANGQREVHANGHKRREYPDGTVKIVYPDGSQETRYSNGRVRLKNKDGKLVMDSETISI